jgi:hypothetical protein
MTTALQTDEPDVVDSCAETVRVRVLPETAFPQCACSEAPAPGFDPYSSEIGALTARPRHRRTLDDMRRLSEEIVGKRRRSK